MTWFLFTIALFGLAPSAELEIVLTPTGDRGLAVTERWTLEGEPSELVRSVFLRSWSGRPPLAQRVTGLHVAGATSEVMRYGSDRVRVALSATTAPTLSYTLHGALHPTEPRGELVLRLYDAPALSAVSVRLEAGPDARLSVSEFPEAQRADGSLTTRGGPLPADSVLHIRVEVPDLPPAPAYGTEALRQLGVPAVAVALLFALALIALVFPPVASVAVMALGQAAALGTTIYLMLPLVAFDVLSPQYTGVERLTAGATAALAYAGLLGALAWVALRLLRLLRRAHAEAWHLAFGVPVLYAVLLWPAAELEPAFWLVPLIPAAPLLAWWTPGVRTWIGAARYRIAEVVRAEGVVELGALAQRFRLSRSRLESIVRGHPELPLVVDWEAGQALSPDAAALRDDLALCPGCGGATHVTGAGLVTCRHCDREYAAMRAAVPLRPVPNLVAALASLLDALGVAILVWTALMVIVAFFDELVHAGFGAAVGWSAGVAAIGGLLGWLARQAGKALTDGRGYGPLFVALLLLTPLVVPLAALVALRSRRNLLHFSRWSPSELDRELATRGEMSLVQLGAFLRCSHDEAAGLAVFLTGADQIDAVYDRSGARIVARDLYRTLARERACRSCGGLLGVASGTLTCHHCGRVPEAA